MALTDINQSTKEQEVQDVIDINIEGTKKQKFRINGDNGKILELNTSDLGIFKRLEEGYTKLSAIMQEIAEIDTEEDDMSARLQKADTAMREQLDYIFDSNVSEVCCGNGGTMYDPINGNFRWENILDALTNLYADNLNREYKKMKSRVGELADKHSTDHQKGTSRGTTKSNKRKG